MCLTHNLLKIWRYQWPRPKIERKVKKNWTKDWSINFADRLLDNAWLGGSLALGCLDLV